MSDIRPPVAGKDKFVFVFASDFDSVRDNHEPGQREGESWLDTLDAPAADEVLTALRIIFTTTYRQDFADDADSRMLADVRQFATNALAPLGNVLRKLRLKPVSAHRTQDSVLVFKFVVIARGEISRRVRDEESGKQVRVIDVKPGLSGPAAHWLRSGLPWARRP